MRVEYIKPNDATMYAALDAVMPPGLGLPSGRVYGESFPTPKPILSAAFPQTIFDLDEKGSDILVFPPGEYDDGSATEFLVAVVMVDRRCGQNPQLLEWFRSAITRAPDGPSAALLFVPEVQGKRTALSLGLERKIAEAALDVTVIPYFPPLVK